MRVEVQKATHFLTNLVRIHCAEAARLEMFCRKLECMLCAHYSQHWFPDKPCKGSGYRCIRINHKMDPILAKAATECGFQEDSLPTLFPSELTLWIDPREVSYRIGENGSICVLYDASTHHQPNDNSPWTTPKRIPTKNNQSSSSESDEDDSPMSTSPSSGLSSDDDLSASPMSMSPPSPKFNRPSNSCKESLRESGFIMDPHSLGYEFPTYVAS